MAPVLPMLIAQTKGELLQLLRDPAFIISSVALPTIFFAFFGLPVVDERTAGTGAGDYLLASFGAYGVISVMLFSFGAGVAAERGRKTDVLMRATPLRPAVLFCAKTLSALLAFATLVVLLLREGRGRRRARDGRLVDPDLPLAPGLHALHLPRIRRGLPREAYLGGAGHPANLPADRLRLRSFRAARDSLRSSKRSPCTCPPTTTRSSPGAPSEPTPSRSWPPRSGSPATEWRSSLQPSGAYRREDIRRFG